MAPATIAVTAAAPAQNLALGLFEGWLLNASASGWANLFFIVFLTRMVSQPSDVSCARHLDVKLLPPESFVGLRGKTQCSRPFTSQGTHVFSRLLSDYPGPKCCREREA